MEVERSATVHRTRRLVLLSCIGLALLLGGLAWDAAMHQGSPELAAQEGPLTLANPSHLVSAIGLVVTVVGVIGAAAQLVPAVAVLAVVATLLAGGVTIASAPETVAHEDAGQAAETVGGHDDTSADPETVVPDDNATNAEAVSCRWANAHDNDPGGGRVIHGDTGTVTADDCAAAEAFLTDIRYAVEELGYADIGVAIAAGYAAPQDAGGPALHYNNRDLMTDGRVADPFAPESLVYSGWTDEPKLIGVLFQTNPFETPTQPAGPLTTWHDHAAQACAEMGDPEARSCDPDAPRRTMMHVWLFEDAVDPFGHGFREARGL